MSIVQSGGNLVITLPDWLWVVLLVFLVLGVLSLFAHRGRYQWSPGTFRTGGSVMDKRCADKPDPEGCNDRLRAKRMEYQARRGYSVAAPKRNERGERWCSCGHYTAIESFNRNKRCEDGLDTTCKEHMKERRRRWGQRRQGYIRPASRRNEAGERYCPGYHGVGAHFAPDAAFSNSRMAADGLAYVCKQHARESKMRPEATKQKREASWAGQGIVGMTVERYEEMLSEQGGHCYLCPSKPGKMQLSVDHDHATGRPRSLLCNKCNSALERLENHNRWGERALAYLKEFSGHD